MDSQEMLLEDGRTILLVHFVYRSPRGTLAHEGTPLANTEETYKIACAPRLVEMSAFGSRAFPWQRTDDVRAVSCPLCRETVEFQKAQHELATIGQVKR